MPDHAPGDRQTAIEIRVLLFAALRDALGTDEQTVRLAEPASGADLLARLAAEHPEIARYRSVIRLAVNERYAPGEVRLQDGDVVALITPVSGG